MNSCIKSFMDLCMFLYVYDINMYYMCLGLYLCVYLSNIKQKGRIKHRQPQLFFSSQKCEACEAMWLLCWLGLDLLVSTAKLFFSILLITMLNKKEIIFCNTPRIYKFFLDLIFIPVRYYYKKDNLKRASQSCDLPEHVI